MVVGDSSSGILGLRSGTEGPLSIEDAVDPIPVEIVEPLSARQVALSVLGPALSPVGTGAIVIVLVVFMLIRREDVRNRFIHMIGSQQLNATTQALDDAAHRVSRYLLMQLAINSGFGLVARHHSRVIRILTVSLFWGILVPLPTPYSARRFRQVLARPAHLPRRIRSEMLFIHKMWDHESERIGLQRCTPIGYVLHEIAWVVGCGGGVLLLVAIWMLIWSGINGTFQARQLLLLGAPFALGVISETVMAIS